MRRAGVPLSARADRARPGPVHDLALEARQQTWRQALQVFGQELHRAGALFLTWAGRHGEEVQALPQRPKVGKRHRDVLSREEIERMEKTAFNERDKLIVRLLADCGLRRNELIELKLDDVVRSQNRLVLRVRGKGDRDRRVPVPLGLISRLARFVASRPVDCVADALFVSVRRGPHTGYEPLGGSGVAHMIRDLAIKAGIGRPVHPHLLRHSWMTEMLRRGVNPIQLSVIAGASQDVIAQHYAT